MYIMDDASTDSSVNVARGFAKKDSRVGFVMVRNQIQILILYLQVEKKKWNLELCAKI